MDNIDWHAVYDWWHGNLAGDPAEHRFRVIMADVGEIEVWARTKREAVQKAERERAGDCAVRCFKC